MPDSPQPRTSRPRSKTETRALVIDPPGTLMAEAKCGPQVASELLRCQIEVGIDDDELRIDLMNQLTYFLPHLLSLSCSSPFWNGRDTGLKSYRLTIFDTLPRTGLPERFASFAEYERHVQVLIDAGLIEDSTKIWWDLRPSGRYPTLETRIMDVCTRLDDTIALTALLVCIMRMRWRWRR